MLPSTIGAATIPVHRPERIPSDGTNAMGFYDDDKLTIQMVSSLCEGQAEQTSCMNFFTLSALVEGTHAASLRLNRTNIAVAFLIGEFYLRGIFRLGIQS
jgi:hypothetical protein